MKHKRLLISGTSAMLIAAAFMLTSSSDTGEGQYTPRTQRAQGYTGALEYYHELHANENGEVLTSEILRARKEAEKMPRAKGGGLNLQWTEMGPDNVGGRTRAILVIDESPNIVFAGGVTGGLWKTTNSGNYWQKVTSFPTYSVSCMARTGNGRIYVGTGSSFDGASSSGGSGSIGDGLWYSDDMGVTWARVPGTDPADAQYTNGTGVDWTLINEIAADPNDPNKIWIAKPNGPILTYDGNNMTPVTGISGTIGYDINISTDGQVIVLGTLQFPFYKTWVSNDGGATFFDATDTGLSNPIPRTNISRIEYAISPDDPNYIYAVLANSGETLGGVWLSTDKGNSWYEIGPGGTAGFTPLTSAGGQGFYDLGITVVPGKPWKCIFGGVTLWKWEQAVFDPNAPFGQFEQIAANFAPGSSSIYVHSDLHEFEWTPGGALYIGTDGGIFKTFDEGLSYSSYNHGYNVTQFYGIGVGPGDQVIGGTQDNGTQYIDHTGFTWNEARRVNGGDGFDCAISNLFPNVLFSSIYFGDLQRSDDNGDNFASFYNGRILSFGTPGNIGGGLGSFFTNFGLYENPNDINTQDLLLVAPLTTMYPGDTLWYTSMSQQTDLFVELTDTLVNTVDTLYPDMFVVDSIIVNGITGDTIDVDTLNYIVIGVDSLQDLNTNDTIHITYLDLNTTYFTVYNHEILVNCVATAAIDTVYFPTLNDTVFRDHIDTICAPDPISSILAVGFSGDAGVWITRNSLRFAAAQDWWKVIDPSVAGWGTNTTSRFIEFDKTGDHMYVGASGGKVFRVSGLNSAYTIDEADIENGTNFQLTVTQIFEGPLTVTGLDVDPQNSNHVVITMGGFSGVSHVYETFNAVSAPQSTNTSNFTSISSNLPGMPVYDVIIDREDPNVIVLGTELGVYATEDGGTSWTNQNNGMEKVPVYEVIQQWRDWGDGVNSPGVTNPGTIYLGTHGRGFWKTGTLIGINDPDNTLVNNKYIAGLKVYPNPMSSNGAVEFNLNETTDVQLYVFDIHGRQVEYISRPRLAAGQHTLQLDVDEYATGTYMVNLIAGDESEVSKFVVYK